MSRQDIQRRALDVACAVLSVQYASLLFADEEKGVFFVREFKSCLGGTNKIDEKTDEKSPEHLKLVSGKIPFSKHPTARKAFLSLEPQHSSDPKVLSRLPHVKAPHTLKNVMCSLIHANPEKMGVLEVINKKEGAFTPEDVQACALLSMLIGQALKIALQIELIKEMNEEVFDLVTSMVDAKDEYTAGHSKRVGYYAAKIGQVMGLPESEISKLRLGGTLHDIGKIGIHDNILKKPARLTPAEYAEIMKHPEISAKMLKKYKYFRDIIDLAQDHHLRPDGKGYPKKKDGSDDQYKKWEDVTVLSRIVTVADVFDAMWGGRNYQARRSLPDIVSEFRQLKNIQFDPDAVEALITYLEKRHGKEALQESPTKPTKKAA